MRLMPDGNDAIAVEIVPDIGSLPADQWDRCAGQHRDDHNPFVSHAFLSAVENSGSVGEAAGWIPRHLVIRRDDTLVACAPTYLKTHSYGEYVFDWSWADAYARAGGRYYPKLLCAAPFTPVTGPRLLVRDDVADKETLTRALGLSMVQIASDAGLSSVHINFTTEAEWRLLGEAGYLRRLGFQFMWDNDGYQSFEDFLGALSSRKRKALRKERREAADHNITFRTLTGAEITQSHWDRFFRFYLDTSDRKWGEPYLNKEFFYRLGESLGDQVVMFLAESDGQAVAGALNLRGGEALYGRYWGCLGHYKFLHFELCYYQAIDYAIAHGLKRVEAGAQGAHKIKRGYLPKPTYSAHWIGNASFKNAVQRFVDAEREAVEEDIADLIADASPYKNAEN